jgi:hypothetical protein
VDIAAHPEHEPRLGGGGESRAAANRRRRSSVICGGIELGGSDCARLRAIPRTSRMKETRRSFWASLRTMGQRLAAAGSGDSGGSCRRARVVTEGAR